MNSRRFRIFLTALLVPIAFGVHALQDALDARRSIHFVDLNPVFLPNGRMLRWMSMGYSGLFGDWLWLRSVLYYGRRAMDEDNPYLAYSNEKGTLKKELKPVNRPVPQFRPDQKIQKALMHNLFRFENSGLVDYIYPLLDRVTTVDPHFIFPYIFGGVYVLMDTGDLDAAEALLRRGTKENPDSWQLTFYLGWFYWMYRGDENKSRQYMLEAAGKPGCATYVYDILKGLSKYTNTVELTRSYLKGIYQSTDNPEVRSRIEKILNDLEDSSDNQTLPGGAPSAAPNPVER
jgi:hypothetical protein